MCRVQTHRCCTQNMLAGILFVHSESARDVSDVTVTRIRRSRCLWMIQKMTGNGENTNMLLLGYPFSLRLTLGGEKRRHLHRGTLSFGPLVAAQVQGLFTGHAPVVRLLPQLVVLQGGLVVHWQPLDGVCGESLEEQRPAGGAVTRRPPQPWLQNRHLRLTFK